MNEYVLTQEEITKTEITKDQFSPSQAKEVVAKLIDDQLNFYKLLNLKNWVADNSTNESKINEKISALQRSKEELMEVINQAREQNCKVSIDAMIELKLDNN